MNPAWSIVFFTTLAGCAQGLVVALAVSVLSGLEVSDSFLLCSLVAALLLLLISLASSFLHLGNKRGAWRAVLMWRTSWMSREVIVLPAFIGVVAIWWLSLALGVQGSLGSILPWVCLLLALALWYCTAMIYACLRFVQEWAHPLTAINYTLIGLSCGLVLAGALAVLGGERALLQSVAPWALALTLAAWITRMLSLLRNAGLKPKSTLQSATGIKAARLVQQSMGMSAGSYNTVEFFHRASLAGMRHVKLGFIVLGFALPCALLRWHLAGGSDAALVLAVPLQFIGILAERWFFFAQARHPQNLYYQVVS